ncbi:MAG: hypothetical protein JWM46_415 [Candidatus Kaiserbacteria bacterium]|nr:hypothetical protein [Candidatus Kaiserbacteria bacterium]
MLNSAGDIFEVMDIEQLSKSQIVLLTLLITFVTSIATGIVTVSLMEQAPPVVEQTVNRVIEHTVQTVAPAAKGQPAAAATTIVTQEKTVVVNDSERISAAVARITPSVVRVMGTQSGEFLALGLVIDAQGTVITDSAALESGDVTLTLDTGAHVRAFVTKRDKASGLAYMQPATSTEKAPVWHPASLVTDSVLGTSVVAISGKTVTRIDPGVVTALPADSVLDTNISASSIIAGSPLLNTDGNIIGISTSVSRAVTDSGFISASVLIAPAPPLKK